jgi:hypothetical protein
MPQTESSSGLVAEEATVDTTDVTTEASSTSSAGVEKASFLDAVEAALEPKKEVSPTSESGEEQAKPDAGAAETEEGDPAELTDQDLQSLSAKTQKRIRNLVAQRDEVTRELDALKPEAEQWRGVIRYMRDNSIEPQEFDNALAITSLINTGDYERALKVLTPIYRELAQRAGEILPNDLAEEVRLGRISEQHARELNRNRARAVIAEQRETRTREQTSFERQSQRGMVDQAVRAVDDWAKGKAGSDPDWKEKHEYVAELVELELSRLGPQGFPQTRQAAIGIAEAALKKVEKQIKRFKPKLTEERHATGTSASPKAKAKPGSYMEAIDQALSR